MEPLKYFIFNSTLIIAIVALIAFILGWLFSRLLCKNKKIDNSDNNSSSSNNQEAKELKEKLKICNKKREILEKDLRSLGYEVIYDENNTTTLEKSADDDTIGFNKESENYFTQKSDSGKVKKDDDLGFLYIDKPDEVDDLKEINGIGEVINKKLNDFGVYTFRQIALWNKKTSTKFAEKLDGFKDRIFWDDWAGQARKLHKNKYKDKL